MRALYVKIQSFAANCVSKYSSQAAAVLPGWKYPLILNGEKKMYIHVSVTVSKIESKDFTSTAIQEVRQQDAVMNE